MTIQDRSCRRSILRYCEKYADHFVLLTEDAKLITQN